MHKTGFLWTKINNKKIQAICIPTLHMHPSCQHAKQHCATDSREDRTATSVALLFSFLFFRRRLLLFYTKHKILWWLSLQVVPLCVLTLHPKLVHSSHIT